MSVPENDPPVEPLRSIMERLGVDLQWYDKNAGVTAKSKAIPLFDDRCGRLSVYLLKKNGTLWTVEGNGEPYMQVRDTGKQIPRDIYICACCKAQAYSMDVNHRSEGKPDESSSNGSTDEGISGTEDTQIPKA